MTRKWPAMPKGTEARRQARVERRLRERDAEAQRRGHRCEIDFNEAELAALDAANEKVGKHHAHREWLSD